MFYDRDMPKVVKKQADQIMAALDNCDEIGGVRGLKMLQAFPTRVAEVIEEMV